MLNEVKKYEHIDELDIYFREVNKYKKRLSKEDEENLAHMISVGDKSALDKLVRHNLRLVITMAKRYRKFTDVSFSDLISEGNVGLIKAAKKFDPSKNVKFSSYAAFWIKASINECIESYNEKYESSSIDDGTFTNISDKDSLYDSVNEEFEKRMSDLQSRRSAIEDLTGCLEEREKKIIMLFYGLGGYGNGMNLEEISKEMCLTKERIRQIKDDAIVKMQCKALGSEEFEAYRNLR